MIKTAISDAEFDFVSQNAHALGGALAVLGPAALLGEWYAVGGAVLVMVFAAVKEFWYDEHYETAEVRGSSLRDFTFYGVGAVTALLLCGIRLAITGSLGVP